LANPALRDEAVSKASSVVSTIEGVRTALLDFQRQFAAHPPDGKRGAVLDGRDIGTVVCPDADVKIFLTASPEARADRRHKELLGKGVVSIYSRVLADVKERDLRDGRRKVAPMVRAEDAFVLDSTGLDVDAVFAAALEFVAARTADR
jgi:cytidylate kinase